MESSRMHLDGDPENMEIFMEKELNPICAAKHANMLSCMRHQVDGGSCLPMLSTA